jgi:hypothetical protein
VALPEEVTVVEVPAVAEATREPDEPEKRPGAAALARRAQEQSRNTPQIRPAGILRNFDAIADRLAFA